jgi:hypothetical protein
LNAWITLRTVSCFAANITAMSGADRPCIDARTIPARRNRTGFFAVRATFTNRCASSGPSSRTKTSGCLAITSHLQQPASTTTTPGPSRPADYIRTSP